MSPDELTEMGSCRPAKGLQNRKGLKVSDLVSNEDVGTCHE